MSKSKYLDLAGLTVYDKKLKEWFKSGVVDITDDAINALFATEDGYTLITLKKVDISNISYEEVDLGLSVKWANKNIGAQTVEDYGTYFSWGNTDGYTVSTKFLTVDEACQLFSSATGETITTKEELENMLSESGVTVDNLGIVEGYSFDDDTYNGTAGAGFTGDVLDSTYDAATVNMGDSWRIPTINEYQELVNAVKSSDGTKGTLTCQYEYIDLNGEQQSLVVYNNEGSGDFSVEGLIIDGSPIFKTILGFRFTNDDTGASVYFPACGLVSGSILEDFGFNGSYWSSSILDTTIAHNCCFFYGGVDANFSSNRYGGFCVRGVK